MQLNMKRKGQMLELVEEEFKEHETELHSNQKKMQGEEESEEESDTESNSEDKRKQLRAQRLI